MKNMIRRITAAVLAAATAMALCLTASAEVTKSEPYTGKDKYRLTFDLTVTRKTVAGAAYQLDVSTVERGSKPYKFSTITVKAILYGNSTTNSVAENSVEDAYKCSVSVIRGTSVSKGTGTGSFEAYDETYGTVIGSLDN